MYACTNSDCLTVTPLDTATAGSDSALHPESNRPHTSQRFQHAILRARIFIEYQQQSTKGEGPKWASIPFDTYKSAHAQAQ